MVRSPHQSPHRPGVILLIVVIMLALFAVIGLSFVLYAETEATSSRIFREAQSPSDPPLPSELLLSWALGQLIYDCPDDGVDPLTGKGGDQSGFGPQSAMRGHSLARLMYGWNWLSDGTNASRPLAPSNQANNNVVAFNGSGATVHPTHAAIVNYQYFALPFEPGVYDPERDPTTLRTSPSDPTVKPYQYPFNVPYTYPDRNNMFLAAVNADGRVLMPSFYRPWLTAATPGGPALLPLDPNDPNYATNYPNWATTNPTTLANLRHKTLRPLPGDMYYNAANPSDPHNFPLPQAGGDVKNLVSAPGGNDSIWMDLGFPVKTTRTGRKYKPLFAFLVMDLDGRVNINVHGNVKGHDLTTPTLPGHASNQGLGKHEVDLSKVFIVPPAPGSPAEWTQLILGQRFTQPYAPGRYGIMPTAAVPPNPPPTPGLNTVDAYPQPTLDNRLSYLFPFDFDAVNEGAAPSSPNLTTRFQVPIQTTTPIVSFRSFPNFNPATADPGFSPVAGYGNMTPTELAQHPLMYNVLNLRGDDQTFTMDNMFHLSWALPAQVRDYQKSTIYTNNLVTNNLDNATPVGTFPTPLGAHIRQLITTHSYDLDVPGAAPGVVDPRVDGAYTWVAGASVLFPSGPLFTYPPPLAADLTKGDYAGMPYPTLSGPVDSKDRRTPVLSRLDLNRKLTPYFDINGVFQLGTPPASPGQEPPAGNGFYRAQWDRQQFAKDIYDRLLLVTTGVRPNSPIPAPAAGTADYDARRWLAQLAVNIVDYIDDDDFITPFFWDPADPAAVVYGVESPKLVINEAYAEIRNDVGDTDLTKGAQKPFKVNFWIELLNPHNKAVDSTGADVLDPNMVSTVPGGPVNRAAVQLRQPGPAGNAIYQILVTDNAAGYLTDLATRANTSGDIKDTASIKLRVDFKNATAGGSYDPFVILPADGAFAKPPTPGLENQGFMVFGPEAGAGDFAAGTSPTGATRVKNNGAASGGGQNALTYDEPQTTDPQTFVTTKKHAIILQRLLCPLVPPNPLPGQPVDPSKPYNPYVTVDVLALSNPAAPALAVQDAVAVFGMAAQNRAQFTGPHYAFGRPQPYAGDARLLQVQTRANPAPGSPSEPQTTFFQHNADAPATTPPTTSSARLTMPFDWMVHLDRALVSPLELTHVAAVPPHLLTQQFILPPGIIPPGPPPPLLKFRHTAPWAPFTLNDPTNGPMTLYSSNDVQNARIYRALEYFTVGDRSIPSPTGGRLPGMININTIWDIETFRALCSAYPDPAALGLQPDGHFIDKHIEVVWNEILKMRTPGLQTQSPLPPFQPPALSPTYGLSQADSPFWSYAAPAVAAPSPSLSELSLVRTALSGTQPNGTLSIFAPEKQFGSSGVNLPPTNDVGQHPYLLNEVLSKIAPHVTTRSNVFAVYLTVGFFEVMDSTTTPPKLGAEIQTLVSGNSDVAKNFRPWQMFAIVDRTNLALDIPTSAADTSFRLRQANGTPVAKPFHLSSPVSVPAGSTGPHIPVPPGTMDSSGTYLTITYDGNSYPIIPNTPTSGLLWADTGIYQEQVLVTQVFPKGVPNDPNYPTLQITFKYPHAAGFRLSNVQLGNPGPQGPIDYSTPQYKSVVPYTFIIE